MNRPWTNHRTKDTYVPGEKIHNGDVTDTASRAASPRRHVAGGHPRGL
jgi:hypothetical protein